MTLFWMICAVLLLVALLFVVLPLWRASGNNNDVLRDAANLEILRDQSVELDTDLRNGLLTQEAYEQGKRELQSRLLEEVETNGKTVKLAHNPAKVLALVLALLLPLTAVPLYLVLGNSGALVFTGGHVDMSPEAMLKELERKVERNPNDPNELVTLARGYIEMKQFPQALEAYKKLAELVPEEPQVWVEYAQAYAINHNDSLLGEASVFLDKALALNPDHDWALGLSGSAAMERGDYVAAITHWQRLVELLPPDSPDAQQVQGGILKARGMLAMQPGGKQKLARLPAPGKASGSTASATAVSVSGRVALSPELAASVAPTDTVFIIARAASGPKMPLAVLRKQVKDLPLEFMLDDSMAMQPELKLSGFDQVVVIARVSKSGNAMSQPGDFQGMTAAVKPGSKGLKVVIDTPVK
ncbi:MAG: c-type cytochrome biogenesis protein CcmI [Gallionella sp.]|nr:c-type cytochrome biogenesis protein CcmI [Gallionella sp.]